MFLSHFFTSATVMNVVALAVGVYLVVSLVECQQYISTAALDNLTNAVSLTENNFDEKIANKHHFVLFYVER